MSDKVDSRLLQRDFYPAWSTERMRSSDVDRNDHAHNAVYIHYFEGGRYALLREQVRIPLHITGMVARVTIDYLHEIRFPATLDVGSAVLRIGRTSVTLAQAIFVHGRCAAVAETVIAFFDRDKGEKAVLEGDVRAALAALSPGV